MKMRNGFVSNSSSSSFVIIGEEISISDVTKKDLTSKKYDIIASTGKYYERCVFAKINNEKMIEILKDKLNNHNITIYKAYISCFDYIKKISKKNLPETFSVYAFEADQTYITNVEDLEYIYNIN